MRRVRFRVRWGRVCGLLLGVACLATAAELRRTRAALDARSRELAALQAERARDRSDLEAVRALYAQARATLRARERLMAQDGQVPVIAATVRAVEGRSAPVLIELRLVGKGGVEVGTHFTIYRGDRFIARVIVESVSGDVAVCRLLFHAEGQSVRPGDPAVTRLV